MPTINQLVRKGRRSQSSKSKAPALNYGYNSMKKSQVNNPAPQKRGVATRVGTMLQQTFLVLVTTFKNIVLS